MKVGLVLGGGGVMGGGWLVGALHGLGVTTGWDPASADLIVGTSAGSMIGALLAAGVPPWFMVATVGGKGDEAIERLRRAAPDLIPAGAAEAGLGSTERVGGAVFRLSRAMPMLAPASLPLAAGVLAGRRRTTAFATLAAWLPFGPVSTTPLRETVRRVVPEGWGPHKGLWVVAVDLLTGQRVVFGRDDAYRADLADAVAASGAIPGFYRPVRIGTRRYVDGGTWSPSNLDLLARRNLDLVICLNPLSATRGTHGRGPAEPGWARLRRRLHLRVDREAEAVRASGTDVVLIEPTSADLAAMGVNLMRRTGLEHVITTAVDSVAAQVRQTPELANLPPAAVTGRVVPPVGVVDDLPMPV